MAVVRRADELFIAGDWDGAFAVWSEEGVAIPPPEWPERGPWRGPAEMQRLFEGWSAAFGADWMTHLVVSRRIELDDGRILSEYELKASGMESGIPVEQELAGLYTVREGQLVKAEYFMNHRDARKSGGLE
jgi:ketosteroid isomerase-like protein